MGFLNACLGLAYVISPMDAVPDFVPVATSRDQSVTEIATEMGKTVLSTSKDTLDQVMTQAKKQVGLLDDKPQD